MGIRQRRQAQKVSLRSLAKQAGFSGAYLSQVERGLVPPPSSKKIVALAKALGESPEELTDLAGRDRWLKVATWVRQHIDTTTVQDQAPPPLYRLWQQVGVEAWQEAMHTLQTSLVTGLTHGHFEFTVRGARTRAGACALTLNLGTVHQFTMSKKDIAELGFLFGAGQRVKSKKARR